MGLGDGRAGHEKGKGTLTWRLYGNVTRFPSPSAATTNSNASTPYTDFVPFGFGAGPQQPQPQHNVPGGGSGFGLKDRAGELKFDYSHAPPPQAQPQYAQPPQYQPYGFNYAQYEFQQPPQQQQTAHGAAQAFMATENALGMLVTSATQSSDALPLKEDPRASNKYRPFGNDHFMHQPQQSPPHQQQQQQAMFSSSPGDRHDQQFLPLKYLPTTAAAAATQQLPAMDQAQQQQQQQQHYSRMVSAANPPYNSTGSFYTGTPTHRLSSNVHMDLVSPAQAAAMGSTYDLGANAQQHQHQRNYSLNLRMSQLLPGSNALTNRRKDDAGGTVGGASASASSFDQQSVINKASVYADAASASLLSEVSAGVQTSTNALYSSAMGGSHHAPQSLGASHDQVCSLCLGGQCDRISHTCGHRFHSSCLQDWGEKSSCPICGQVPTHPLAPLRMSSDY